ncbi:MAG: sensor histidine kinase, partial [Cyanobacteria bacterium J149]
TLVDEIVNLGVLQASNPELEITSVDIEMLCQQIVNSLNDFAKQRQQELRLSVEPGNRIWLLDKEKSKQALYYLVMSVLESSEAGGELRIHVSRRHNHLNIAVWISHPWLGEGLPQVEVYSSSVANALTLEQDSWGVVQHRIEEPLLGDRILTSAALMSVLEQTQTEVTPKEQKDKSPRENLGLLLTCHLVELHGGQVIIQGSADGGYRYLMKLPKINADNV